MFNINISKRNTPISTLMKNFINKKSGKVDESRKELMRRFDYLDWKDQKKILSAFLDSGKTDRNWAYWKLTNNWDKSFEPKLKVLWEQFHEERCAWPIIHNFPVEYISENIDRFTEEKDYYHICLRLAHNKTFEIDKERLSPADYITVVANSKRYISIEEATDILYKTVHQYCVNKGFIPRFALNSFALDSGRILGPKDFKDVSRVLDAIYILNDIYNVEIRRAAFLFDDWNKKIKIAISESPEYKSIPSIVTDFGNTITTMLGLAYKYSYLALPDKYKLPSDPDVNSMLYQYDYSYLNYENPPF